jgi:hypothetical protein
LFVHKSSPFGEGICLFYNGFGRKTTLLLAISFSRMAKRPGKIPGAIFEFWIAGSAGKCYTGSIKRRVRPEPGNSPKAAKKSARFSQMLFL